LTAYQAGDIVAIRGKGDFTLGYFWPLQFWTFTTRIAMRIYAKLCVVLSICAICLTAIAKDNLDRPELKVPDSAEKLTIALQDADLWNGNRIPKTMQCAKLGGKQSSSPSLVVSGVPNKAKSLIAFFENPRANHNQGLIRAKEGRDGSNWLVPAVRSGNAADRLPKGIEIYDGGSTWGQAYSAPCPSSGSWLYTVTVYALDENDLVIGSGKREIGWAP